MRLFGAILAVMLLALGGFAAWARGSDQRELARAEARLGASIAAGDVVFQDLECGARCELIRQVTHSRYVHVGLVVGQGDARVVWEAFAPVGPTPLAEWVARGKQKQIAVYRLDGELRGQLPKIEAALKSMAGRPYDGDYNWDDERIYCSELVAKAVQQATGVELFAPHPSGPGSFGPQRDLVTKMSHGRLSEDTPLVSPFDLTRSTHLSRIVDELQ
ncbi:MAG: YiiX/YebB-like N1pC/P60 family cysteine hydrolase [Myxococcaceae bacterium]